MKSERPKARQGTLLVRPAQSAVADNVRDQNRRQLPSLAHCVPRRSHLSTIFKLELPNSIGVFQGVRGVKATNEGTRRVGFIAPHAVEERPLLGVFLPFRCRNRNFRSGEDPMGAIGGQGGYP